MFSAFLPAVSRDALKKMNEEVRAWRVHLRTATELDELAAWINPVVRGWMTYYGRFYRTELDGLLKRINTYLVRWGTREVQAAQDIQESPQVVGRADRKAAATVRPLGMDDRIPEQPIDETSGVKGELHLRSGEPGGEIPPGHPAIAAPANARGPLSVAPARSSDCKRTSPRVDPSATDPLDANEVHTIA